MKLFTLLGLVCLSFFSAPLLAQSNTWTSSESNPSIQRTCFAHEKHVEMMGFSKYAEANERIEEHTAQWAPIVAAQRAANQNAVVTIPVVFHVVYRTATENISAEQVQSQLDVLNADFRRLNADADGVWPQAADTEIEFCLASFDPEGNPTDGILRVPTSVNGFGTNDAVKSASSGGSDAWPYTEYLNFWVCNIGGGILGYAQFPGTGSGATDGVVCGYQYTGTTGTATSPFDLGRTATHEVGHWLNLRHIWGDGGCSQDDFVGDTPASGGANYGCDLGSVDCSSTDMVQNYMDYSDDACMNLFTQGQTDRMLALFASGGFRESLLTSDGCAPPCDVSCGCTDDAACNFDASALNDDGSCDFGCYGCTESSACNYDPAATIDDGNCIAGGTQTFTMNLTPDNYGSETAWTLTDATGTTVMSGGPYTNNDNTPITVNEQLCFGCYTLSVNDSYGDGMCCQFGNGSYSFSVNGEVVASGATFTNSDVSNFCAEPTDIPGCTTEGACNYNASATIDDGSCQQLDACGVCGGPGEIYECGCSDTPAGDCDCNGNQLDECGTCGGGGIPSGDCDCNGNQLDALGVCGGTCAGDADNDGICDDVDNCVGTLDECGVCNGPGIPTGDCDCNGNQLDAIDVCGGDCDTDADNDGICDDADDCVGTPDALGVCNGDCTADADGDGICDDVDDCVGELDALGVCNGDCTADVDQDGICDTDEVAGCENETACNYNAEATDDDGSCVFVGDACNDGNAQTLGDVYTNCALPNFGCQGVGPTVIWKETFGDEPSLNYGWNGSTNTAANELEWSITYGATTDYFYTLLANDGDTLFRGRDTDTDCTWISREIDISTFTELKVSAELSEIGGLENADFITVEAIIDGQTNQVINLINDFGTVLIDLADLPDGNVLQFRIVVRTDRNGEYISFDDIYLFGTPNCSDSDSDGLCDEDDNCSDVNACNYTDPTATSCLFDDAVGECGGDCTADADNDGICDDVDDCIGTFDACGICNGPGAIYECGCADIPTGDCDCNGNQEDILGICGGNCTADDDNDGICDDIDDCVGTADACGVCNGPGEVYECGCNDTPVGDCDCNGNQEDALGICGGDCPADADNDGICDNVDDCVGSLDACGVCNGPGAVYECGCNDIPTGDCDCNGNQEDALGICGGDCTADADNDGICDDVDDCIGTLDACGICNGPGAIYECGCADIPTGDCDCNGNQEDAIGECGGTCTVDIDNDGVCDNNEVPGCMDDSACNYNPAATDDDGSCLNNDACGVCGGPGEVYECGCNDTPVGDCDCNGNQEDALGICGGDCPADADNDGICDNVDDCVGSLDACGVCNGPGAVYECGCNDIPTGDCDCNGNQEDALGICGGDCTADADNDGICDNVDDCIGTLDACGICNGPGAIYECGCADIPAGDCDCNGNQEDALGICGGDCTADADSDGICDDVDDCVGTPDACGVCNGPGDIYECGCTNIPAGDCDCNGNQEDAAGVCGGDCASDLDGDGICDTDEIPGCDDPLADNYDSSATDNDGTCVYMPASFDGLVAEAYQLNSVEQGTHTFRVYAQFSNPNDQLISVFGTAANPLSVASSTSFYQDANGGPTSGGSNPLLFPGFPNLEWDSFVTIGSDDNNISGFQTAGLDFSSFEAGEALTSNATAGGSWFVFPDQEPQAFPSAAGRVLIGQFTTDGTVTLNCNIQYRAADGTNPQAIGLTLVFPNNCPEDINGDGLVAVDDILTLLSSFGCTGSNCVGDLDGDDVVGVNDILTVLSAFSTSCF